MDQNIPFLLIKLANRNGRILLIKAIVDDVTEAAPRSVLCKKVFLEISQNSEENACARVCF